jgi:hypothetical protein
MPLERRCGCTPSRMRSTYDDFRLRHGASSSDATGNGCAAWRPGTGQQPAPVRQHRPRRRPSRQRHRPARTPRPSARSDRPGPDPARAGRHPRSSGRPGARRRAEARGPGSRRAGRGRPMSRSPAPGSRTSCWPAMQSTSIYDEARPMIRSPTGWSSPRRRRTTARQRRPTVTNAWATSRSWTTPS